MTKMKISHTYFPNGHRINWWHRCTFDMQFGILRRGGNRVFIWFQEFKEKK